MKIALVYDMIYPYNIGGAEIRNHELAVRLAKRHEVHLFGVKLWDGPDTIKKEGLILHGVCRYRGGNRFDGKRRMLEPLKFAAALMPPLMAEKFDMIDSSAFPYFHSFTCRLVSLIRNTPLVITWHQWWGSYWRMYLGGFWGSVGEVMEVSTVRLNPRHIAVSKTLKNDLVAAGASEKSVFVNYPGFDAKRIKSAPSSKDPYDILFVGRFAHQKNICLLVRAIHMLKADFPDIRACFVGDGPDAGEIMGLVKESGLESNIAFTGLMTDKDAIYGLMKSSKVLALPSTIEGFGIVIAEAKACGLPAVVADGDGNASKELIDGDGLVAQGSPSSLASAISHLLTDDSLRSNMARKALERSSMFSWDKAATELEDYYTYRTGWRQG